MLSSDLFIYLFIASFFSVFGKLFIPTYLLLSKMFSGTNKTTLEADKQLDTFVKILKKRWLLILGVFISIPCTFIVIYHSWGFMLNAYIAAHIGLSVDAIFRGFLPKIKSKTD